MQYREEFEKSKEYKQQYLDGIRGLIEKRQKESAVRREAFAAGIFQNAEFYRAELKKMLGWPLVGHTAEGLPQVKAEKLAEEETHTVWRMQFEVLEGLWMSGLFFQAKGEGKKPFFLVQHGGLGTPELISGVYGDTANYNDMVERVIRHGVHAFAPQLILWDDKYEVPFDRKMIDAQLKRVGSSITAVEIFGLTRILDYFEGQEYVSKPGMVGLSYGGFYTLFTMAVEPRLEAGISCSFFNSRDEIGWCDWVWQDSAEKFDDAEIACLVYPRKIWIQMGNKDQLFDHRVTEESYAKLCRLCKEVGTDWVEMMIFEGNHELCKDDAPIEKLIEMLS